MKTAIYIIIGLFVYFIPSIIGWKTKYASGILILNFLLGWTILGWIAALIWAVSAPKPNEDLNYNLAQKKNNNFQVKFVALMNSIFMKTDTSQHANNEINMLMLKLNKGEAIIKNKFTENYEIVTAEKWERIITANKQADYEVIEEK